MVFENKYIEANDDRICTNGFKISDSEKNEIDSENTLEDGVINTINVSNIQLVQNNEGLSLPYKKTSMDITRTRQYKEIYADNLRQYSFLLSKQLGISNQPNNELRKQYLQSRQKENERRLQCKNEGTKDSPQIYNKNSMCLSLISLHNSNNYLRKSSCPNLQSPVNEEQQFNNNRDEESSQSKSENNSPILSKKSTCSLISNKDCYANEPQRKQVTTAINHKSKTTTKKYARRGLTQPDIAFSLRRSNKNMGNIRAQSLTNLVFPIREIESKENQLDISNLLNSEFRKQYLQSKQKEKERTLHSKVEQNHRSSPEIKTLPRLNSINKEKYSSRKCSCPNLQFNEKSYVERDNNLSQSKSACSSPRLSKKMTSSLINVYDFDKHQCMPITNAIYHQNRVKTKKYSQGLRHPDVTTTSQRHTESINQSHSNLALLINEPNGKEEVDIKILPTFTSQRQHEAEQRYHWRLSRLDSFEGMLAKVNSYIIEEKRNSNPDLKLKL